MAQPDRGRVRAERGRRRRRLRPRRPAARLRLDAAEKTYQTYFFTTRNPGGHSSRPRPDNAIYDLADALKKLQAHRFEPVLNDVDPSLFHRACRRTETGPLGDAMRALARESGRRRGRGRDRGRSRWKSGDTRTRCVATMLSGGHADNALPQSAEATVNCRIMPGVEPKDVEAELQAGRRSERRGHARSDFHR